MIFNRMIGQYRTVKLKIPRQCCAWCQAQIEIVYDKIKALEQRLAEVENNLNHDHSLQLAKMKLETAAQLVGHMLSFEAQRGGVIANPELIEEVVAIVCSSADRLVQRPDPANRNPPDGLGLHVLPANLQFNGATNGHNSRP